VEDKGWIPAGRLAIGNAISVRAGPEFAKLSTKADSIDRIIKVERHANHTIV
jgi:hypothetical protein